jgi:WD40 repeat protein
MRKLGFVGLVVLVAACGKSGSKSSSSSSGAGSGAAAGSATVSAVVPPGLGGAKAALPPATTELRTVQEPQRFRHSSVRGDFRVYRTSAGIVVSWKTMLSARSLDGKPMWKKENQGRAVAVSPDQKSIVTNNRDGELLILDAGTGTPAGAPVQLGGPADTTHTDVWISAFAWTPDGKHILAVDSKHVYLLDAHGAVERELPIKCKDDSCFLASAAAVSNDEAIVTNANGQIMKVKLADGSTLATADYQGNDVDVSADHTQLVVDGPSEVAMFDAATLAPGWSTSMPGYHGVRLPTSGEGSSFQWKAVPKLSPDGKHVVVNDAAGQLWLLDAKTGAPEIAYPTELVDFVEDVMWLDGATLIAIDNPGHVMRISGTPAKVVWSEMDGPEDAEWDQ